MKKLLLLAAALVMSVGAWADFVQPSEGKVFTMHCAATSGHEHSQYINIAANGTINQAATTGSYFTFELKEEGQWYIKDGVTNKYVNVTASGTTLVESADVYYTVDTRPGDGIRFCVNGNTSSFVNNNGALAARGGTGGCSSWVLTECTDVVTGNANTVFEDGWYKIEISSGTAQNHGTYKGYYLTGRKNGNWGITLTQTPDIDVSSWIYITKTSEGNYKFTFNKGLTNEYTVGQNSQVNTAAGNFQFNPRSTTGFNYMFTVWGGNNRLMGWNINNIPSIGNTSTTGGANDACYYVFHKVSEPNIAAVTYNFKLNGTNAESRVFYVNKGDDMPTISLPFYTFEQPTGTVSEDIEKDVVLTWNGPFVEKELYNLGVRLANTGVATYYVKSDGTNAPSRSLNVSEGVQTDDEFLWSFERKEGSVDLFYLKNKKYGYINTTTGSASTMHETNKTAMRLYEYIGTNHQSENKDFGFVDANNATQVFGDHNGSKLGYWSNGQTGNEGSAFQVSPVAYELEIGATGFSTLYLAKNVTIPEGVTAYYCVEDGNKLQAIAFESGDVIPSEVGVVIEATTPNTTNTTTTYQFPYTETEYSGSNDPENDGVLIGTTIATKVSAYSAYCDNIYVLSTVEGNLGFYQFGGETLKANRAFYATNDGAVQGFVLNFGGEGTTGIQSLIESAKTNGVCFDLAGRRVNANAKGISIQNNKKVIR